ADREERADVAEPAGHARGGRAEPGLPPPNALLRAAPTVGVAVSRGTQSPPPRAAPTVVVAVVQGTEGPVDARVAAAQRHRDPRLAEDKAPAPHPLAGVVGHEITPRIRAAAPTASAARSESRSSSRSATTTVPRPLPSSRAAFCPIAR